MAAQMPLAALRWRLIMGVAGTAPRYGPTLRIFVISQFFNQALISTVFGDAARIWLINREGQRWTNAINGVLLDRFRHDRTDPCYGRRSAVPRHAHPRVVAAIGPAVVRGRKPCRL